MTARKIITEFIHPPIPDRCNDWQAYREGDDGDDLFGWGATEAEAIADLLELEGCALDEAEARASRLTSA